MKRLFPVLLLVLALTFLFTLPVFALGAVAQELPPAIDVIIQIASAAFFGLVGFPALFSAVTTLLLMRGLITMAQADTIHVYANILVYGAVFVAVVLGRVDLVTQIDTYLGGLATILASIITVLTGVFGLVSTQRYQQSLTQNLMIASSIRSHFMEKL